MVRDINEFAKFFLENSSKKRIQVISHFDTDGITSAAIITKALERLQKSFSIKIVKAFNQEVIDSLPEDNIILILDLGSGHLEELGKKDQEIFILDHHEISQSIPNNVTLFNPHLTPSKEPLCSAEITYLFAKSISEENKDLAHLAIIGMVGDTMERNITPTRDRIIKDSNVQIKKGLLIYPSTRPLDRALEYSSRPFIPGVTGDSNGTFELLQEIGLERNKNKFKALIDLTDREMKDLTTAVTLRLSTNDISEFIGNLYLIKLFNKIEDAREISAMINACSRMDHSQIALLFCLGNASARKKAEKIHIKYKQQIISGLKYIRENENHTGNEYVIINAKDNVKDTIIGTLASILSFSQTYKEGTIIVAMAYNGDKIKVSTRLAGRNPNSKRNLKELMDSITHTLGQGDSGGHKNAAGCTIDISHEEQFIDLIKKKLEVELVKI